MLYLLYCQVKIKALFGISSSKDNIFNDNVLNDNILIDVLSSKDKLC